MRKRVADGISVVLRTRQSDLVGPMGSLRSSLVTEEAPDALIAKNIGSPTQEMTANNPGSPKGSNKSPIT